MELDRRGDLVLEYMEEADCDKIGPLFSKSFKVYPYFERMIPEGPKSTKGWAETTRYAIKDPKTICLKVVDAKTGIIAAHGRWIEPKAENDHVQPGHEEERWGGSFMEACDQKLAEEMFGSFDRNREKLMEDKPHWYMELLATDPNYWGKGCAAMILLHGLKLADRDGLPCYIDASPMGRPVYEKYGWEFHHAETFEDGPTYSFGMRKPQTRPSVECRA